MTMIPERYRQEAVADAVDRMFRGLAGVVPYMPLLPLVLVSALWGEVNGALLLGWLVVAMAVPLSRHFVARRYLSSRPPAAEAPRWAHWVVLTALIDGVAWGAAGVLLFVPDSVTHQVFVVTMVVGISAGSIFITSYWPKTQYAYAIPAVGLPAVQLIVHGTATSVSLGVGMFVYLIIMHKLTQDAHRAAMAAIALRFENLDLVAQLREQKEFAERANVAKSKFLAAASHDLRQPLHALGLFVAALDERIKRDNVDGLIGNINRSVAALEGLLNALLDISKLDAGTVEPALRDVRLGRLLAQLADEYQPQACSKGLAWRCDGDDAAVYTDPTLLETVLRNLISNAIRYTPHGSVGVEWRSGGDGVTIEVSDTGIGIPIESHHDVYREFFQLHNPERDRDKGLGLGLAIVDRLTKLLRHPLELQSTPGTGSVFKLTLPPGSASAREPVDEISPTATGFGDAAISVLVIDDEAAVREAMEVLLENWGYTVVVAASGEEALALLDSAPEAIIADYRLRDGRTGAEAIHTIRERFGGDIPALLVTGDTAAERIVQTRDSGFAFLHKPVPPAKLRTFLRWAQKHAARASTR